jgi:hypothetical protein
VREAAAEHRDELRRLRDWVSGAVDGELADNDDVRVLATAADGNCAFTVRGLRTVWTRFWAGNPDAGMLVQAAAYWLAGDPSVPASAGAGDLNLGVGTALRNALVELAWWLWTVPSRSELAGQFGAITELVRSVSAAAAAAGPTELHLGMPWLNETLLLLSAMGECAWTDAVGSARPRRPAGAA